MKKGAINFILGFTLGAFMFGSTAAYAVSALAQPATNKILVNGTEAKVEAYIIDGRNYLQLRDLAAAVGFSVVWDGANNQVLVDTSRGYDPNETMPAAAPTAPVPDATPELNEAPAITMTIEEMKAEIIRLTNAERVKAGVPELEVLPALMDCAQAKADDFLDSNYFDHISPVYGTPGEMIKTVIPTAKSAGENIMGWTYTSEAAIEGWMAASGHRANILATKYTHIGLGIVKASSGGYLIVQQFVGL